MIEFVLPNTPGEWLAWLTAFATLLVGLSRMLVPSRIMPVDGLQDTGPGHAGRSTVRGGFGGVYVGLAVAILMLHPQPLLYIALGFAFAGAVIGRFIGFALDRHITPRMVVSTLIELIGAALPLAYVFGIIT